MRIGIIGAGRVGATLGSQWARAGHGVVFGSRDPSAAGVRAAVAGASGSTAAPVEEAAEAEVVVVTVPGPALPTLAAVADRLAGKVVINASNVMGGGPSATDLLGADAPAARQVRAFNTIGVENMADPVIDGTRIDLLWAGDDDTVDVAERLIDDVGFHPVRVGGLDRSDLVDAVFRLWIALAVAGGRGRRLGFQVLTPTDR